RAMFDYAPPGVEWLLDIKTTTDANPDACVRAVMKLGYDVQDRHYRDVWKAVTGEDRRMRFLFCEKEPPHACCVVELGGETDFIATKKIRRAREIWAGCLSSGDWPGYPVGIHTVETAQWHQEQWLERETVEADFKAATGHDVLDIARKWQSPEGLDQERKSA
ncbi:PD-(D/E)XK nuclease-like domain-containing protein, partial [Thioclava sp.]|uniref:PD-(D/E)XK nuclease-like domain-containing protein n=1 Tax=Thioclava sp. TaxID=1933450 RepID=UPI003241FC4A